TRPQRSRQQRRQWRRPQRSRQQRRHATSVKMLTSVRAFAGSGVIGAACALPDTATKMRPANAIASVVRTMCLSLFLRALLVAPLAPRNNAMDEKQDRVGLRSNCWAPGDSRQSAPCAAPGFNANAPTDLHAHTRARNPDEARAILRAWI